MKITVSDAISLAIDEEMNKNTNIFIIGEEVGKSNGTYQATKNLFAKYGKKRVIDAPISEMGFTGLAVGASYAGLIPICEFMTWNFALQAIDHIINSSAKMRYMSGGLKSSSIVFRGPNGYSPGVGAQHTQDFCAWYGSIPGLKVIAPYSAKDHRGCLKTALRDNNPVVILENEILYPKEFEKDDSFQHDFLQEFKCVIEKIGTHITLVGISLTVEKCLNAADKLLKEGIKVEVINLLSIRPLDMETIIRSVEKTRKFLIVDNAWPYFSVSSEVCLRLYEQFRGQKDVRIERLNGKDCPTAYAENLERLSFPSESEIMNMITAILKK